MANQLSDALRALNFKPLSQIATPCTFRERPHEIVVHDERGQGWHTLKDGMRDSIRKSIRMMVNAWDLRPATGEPQFQGILIAA